jgi:hypothetical protein
MRPLFCVSVCVCVYEVWGVICLWMYIYHEQKPLSCMYICIYIKVSISPHVYISWTGRSGMCVCVYVYYAFYACACIYIMAPASPNRASTTCLQCDAKPIKFLTHAAGCWITNMCKSAEHSIHNSLQCDAKPIKCLTHAAGFWIIDMCTLQPRIYVKVRRLVCLCACVCVCVCVCV